MPPRSATDATRFTSTTPHASAKFPPPNSRWSASSQRKQGPAGETPQQKVKRLRAAADAAKLDQISTFDKIVIRGRVWADIAHRVTVIGLLGATGMARPFPPELRWMLENGRINLEIIAVAACVTVYALTDMVRYNRKKRTEFFAEQKARYDAAVHHANTAIQSGIATEAEIDFIEGHNEEQARIDAFLAKKGIFKRASEWMFSGLKKEEQGNDIGGSEAPMGHETSGGVDNSLAEKAIKETTDLKGTAKQAFANEKEKQRAGGPLDRLGTSAENAPQPPQSRGWTSFMTRRS
jgi:hypothetical protein